MSRILSKKIKQEATTDSNVSASTIVHKAVSECTEAEMPKYDLLIYNNLVRKANRIRQKVKYENSQEMDFELNLDFVPSAFLKKDLFVGNERHLIFATEVQLEILSKAKLWYLDGNTSLPCQPFMKIFSIHTYAKSRNTTYLAPLCYVMMSRCFERDYKEVFKYVLELLPMSPPEVETVIGPFEKQLWRAIRATFPDVKLHGCAFQWGKCVWKKAQKLGMKVETLREDDEQRLLMKKILALPFLPEKHIEPAFGALCEMMKNNKKLELLMEYIGSTWISNLVWPISSWTVFMHPVRTSEDVEGWCHRLRVQLRQVDPIFYNIVWLLLQESEAIPDNINAISEEKLKDFKMKEHAGLNGHLFKLWDVYKKGTMSSNIFLDKCGNLYSPEIIAL